MQKSAVSTDTVMKKKHLKRRWTDIENKQLYDAIGKDITAKKMPCGKRIAELVAKMGCDMLRKLEHKCTITSLANCPTQLSTKIFSKVKSITVLFTRAAYHLCLSSWINGSIKKVSPVDSC